MANLEMLFKYMYKLYAMAFLHMSIGNQNINQNCGFMCCADHFCISTLINFHFVLVAGKFHSVLVSQKLSQLIDLNSCYYLVDGR
jgi:hypothetical protein